MLKFQYLCLSCHGAGAFTIPSEGRLICVPCVACDETGQVGERRKMDNLKEINKEKLSKFSVN